MAKSDGSNELFVAGIVLGVGGLLILELIIYLLTLTTHI